MRAGLDHLVYDNSDIWKRSNQPVLLYTLIGGEIAGVLPHGFMVGLHRQF